MSLIRVFRAPPTDPGRGSDQPKKSVDRKEAPKLKEVDSFGSVPDNINGLNTLVHSLHSLCLKTLGNLGVSMSNRSTIITCLSGRGTIETITENTQGNPKEVKTTNYQ